jgi:hypothetical protein
VIPPPPLLLLLLLLLLLACFVTLLTSDAFIQENINQHVD